MHKENNQTTSDLEVGTANRNREPHDDARKKMVQEESGVRGGKLMSGAAKRRERIRQLEARLERERSRETEASRKERNGQLFVWGAMVEGVFRNGDEQERDLIRKWAAKHLTDKRHIQRAEVGFIRVEEEKADCANV